MLRERTKDLRVANWLTEADALTRGYAGLARGLALAAGMPMSIGDLEMHMVAGSGHWTQQEKPEEVNRLILDWLDRRFPK